jgi:hypothetical protein
MIAISQRVYISTLNSWGTRWCKYSGAIPHFILKNNWSLLRYLRSDPSTVKELNKLDIAIRKLDSLSKFKTAIRLNSQSNNISVPKLYYYGPRKLNVIIAQLRCTASFLNHDLHKVHIFSSPACSCSAPQEDPNHFFFACTKYSDIRNDLFLSISDLSHLINASLLTSGSETLSYADNYFIFHSVFRFMKRSKRFLIV